MGLGNSGDPGPAHHHHHHCNAARSGLCDDHRRWHQDHGHLGRGHHPKEGQAVSRQVVGVEAGRRPLSFLYM